MNCPKCGNELAPGSKFCMQCGAKVETQVTCPACGTQLPAGAAFCFSCGHSLKGGGGGGSVLKNNAIDGNVTIDDSTHNITTTTTTNTTNVDNSVNYNAQSQVFNQTTINNTTLEAKSHCRTCGKELAPAAENKCLACGELFCDEHFVSDARLCTGCVDTAVTAMTNGDYLTARKIFRRSIEAQTENPYIYYYAAICLLDGKKAYVQRKSTMDEAVKFLSTAVRLSSQPSFWYLLAYIKYDFYERNYYDTNPDYKQCYQMAVRSGLTENDKNDLFTILGVPKPSCL